MSPSWRDPRWRDSISKLSPSQKLILESSLRGLLEALRSCRDAMRDSALRPWSPARWHSPRRQSEYGQWVELYLGDRDNRGRAIICFDKRADAIYLVARTAVHDHSALRELVSRFKPEKVLKSQP